MQSTSDSLALSEFFNDFRFPGDRHGRLSLQSDHMNWLTSYRFLKKRTVVGELTVMGDDAGVIAERNHLVRLNLFYCTVLDYL